ncbi:DNA-directed primase/polymerase protein [Cebus imitator]|uniref:DNA-directed primase/polymerase protein n=1 Tax=Cebus imitator TaxID=2715852 RepID=UPI001899C2F1|nr:DNA-directed primase/polymerase protein [Cebus imitator]
MNRKWETKLKQIEERASQYGRKPLSSVYRPRLSKPEEPPSIWKLFHRQTQAFNFVKSCKEDVHVFALECKVGDGQRTYLVTTYAELWFYYKSRKNLLHCYEVIPENAVCKLYFDLEFNKPANPSCKGTRVLHSLLIECEDKSSQDVLISSVFLSLGNFLRKILQPAFYLLGDEDADSAPETRGHGFPHFSEASTKPGFSFNEMFTEKAVEESWTLNSKKLESLGSAEQASPGLSFLVVKNNMGEKHLFVDLGVYTRNRNFRLYKSSKIGKCVALEVAEENRFFPIQSENVSEEYQYFLSSLVSNVRFSDTLRILTCDPSQNKQKGVGYFNSISTSGKFFDVWFFYFLRQAHLERTGVGLIGLEGRGGSSEGGKHASPSCSRWPLPPYGFYVEGPALEIFFKMPIARGGKILVDLKNEVWYQKCHDPVCKAENFKSDCFPLPAEVCLLFLFKEEEEFTTDETRSSETQNPHKPSPSKLSTGASADTDWNNGIDDAYFLEATEDAELAEAAENSLLSYNSEVDEIPDELIIEVLQE